MVFQFLERMLGRFPASDQHDVEAFARSVLEERGSQSAAKPVPGHRGARSAPHRQPEPRRPGARGYLGHDPVAAAAAALDAQALEVAGRPQGVDSSHRNVIRRKGGCGPCRGAPSGWLCRPSSSYERGSRACVSCGAYWAGTFASSRSYPISHCPILPVPGKTWSRSSRGSSMRTGSIDAPVSRPCD